MSSPDFTKPRPNDQDTRDARNKNLGQSMSARSDDVLAIYLETLAKGKTQWRIVFRDGTTEPLAN